MNAVETRTDLSRAAFDRIESRLASPEAPWLAPLRRAAMARFDEGGFPTLREEAWRYTNVARIAKTGFSHVAAGNGDLRLEPESLDFLCPGGELTNRQVVFVGGRYAPELSNLKPGGGIRVRSLGQALATPGNDLEASLGQLVGAEGDAFAALNLSFFLDGALVEIDPGAIVEEPIHLVFFTTGPDGAAVPVAHPRTLVLAGRGSQATVVESYGGGPGSVYLTNAVTEILVEDGARLEHCRVQRDSEEAFHVASLGVRQGRDSYFANHAVELGGSIARCDIRAQLAGEGAECVLNGLFVGEAEQLLDTHTTIDHTTPHCTSRELYKGVLDGRSQGVFNGRVIVREGAQKSNAQQTNKNLLLSPKAQISSIPQLEIFADDVKCNHGSTTGQIDPTALFYLRSRGIGEEAARSLLTYAFASDVIGRFQVPAIRDELESFMRERLPSAVEIEEAIV